MQLWGKDARGKQRYRCIHCGRSSQRRRPDVVDRSHRSLFRNWLLGKQSLEDIASEQDVTRQTPHHWFADCWQEEEPIAYVSLQNQILLIDGKYLGFTASVLIACTPSRVAAWYFTYRENGYTWYEFFSTLRDVPRAIVCDGQRGMLKAIQLRFPSVVVQRCQFHVIQYCTIKLTRNPETTAGRLLRLLALRITRVKTPTDYEEWIADYCRWRQTFDSFLKEKTFQESTTLTGRRRWHYTHGRVHAAYSHLKNALPNLFRYLDDPEIPNTTNYLEGSINRTIQEQLRRHRGLTLYQRRVLISTLLRNKQ